MNKIALIFSKVREDTVGRYIERVFEELEFSFDHYCSSQMKAIPKGHVLYFRVADGYEDRKLPLYLKPSVYWTSDVHLEGPYHHLKHQVKNYNIIFSCLPLGIEKLRNYSNKNIYVPFGCDPKIHKKLNLPKRYDIGFVGTDGGIPRKFILQELRERYPNSFMGLAPSTQMAEIYSQSKVGFNYPIRLEGMTMRSFEIPACGTLQFMPRLPKQWIEQTGFHHKKNIIIYENFSDLVHLIDYYLAHDEEREKIAQAGHEHVLSHHTYKHKVVEIFHHIERELGLVYGSFSV